MSKCAVHLKLIQLYNTYVNYISIKLKGKKNPSILHTKWGKFLASSRYTTSASPGTLGWWAGLRALVVMTTRFSFGCCRGCFYEPSSR